MQIAHWCILIIIVMPYPLVLMARLPDLTLEKNLIPRITSNALTGVRQRLYWAHQNALEMVAPFSIAVLIAQELMLDQDTIDILALSFIVFRIAHALSYAMNKGVLRTLMFGGGMACIITLFVKIV